MAMSEFCHHLRGRDEHGTLLTSGRRTRCTPAETEKLLRDGRARSAGITGEQTALSYAGSTGKPVRTAPASTQPWRPPSRTFLPPALDGRTLAVGDSNVITYLWDM